MEKDEYLHRRGELHLRVSRRGLPEDAEALIVHLTTGRLMGYEADWQYTNTVAWARFTTGFYPSSTGT